MKKQKLTKRQYNDALEFITHLILTKPEAVRRLLARFDVHFTSRPSNRQLINEVVRMLSKNNQKFNDSLTKLISIHIEHKGGEMAVIDDNYDSYEYDEIWGALAGLAGKAIGGIAGLFGKKKNSGGGGGGAAAAIAAQQQAAAARMKADMDAKMRQMQLDQQRRDEEERRRRREEEDRRRREAETSAAKKKDGGSNVMMIGGMAVGALALVGLLLFSMKSKQPAPPTIIQKV